MKRQTLQIGGALLATTALSTFSTLATAGTIENSGQAGAIVTNLTAFNLAAEVFGGTAPQNTVLGPVSFNIDFTNSLTTSFNLDIEPAGAKFATGVNPALLALSESAAGTLSVASLAAAACTVQVLTERILVSNCVNVDVPTSSKIDAINLSGVRFNQANGLATAGTSITLSGIVTGTAGNQTFETISSGTLVTSATSLQISSVTGGTSGAFTLNNAASTPFSVIGTSTTSATLGSVNTSITQNLNAALATTLSLASNLVGGMEFAITHGVLTDAALTKLELSQNLAATAQSLSPSAFVSNTASFDFAPLAAVPPSFEIKVSFDGTTAIQAWAAGSVDVNLSAGTQVLTAPAGITGGALAAFNRGGFQAQINTAQSSSVASFDSFVRITNNGQVAGTATIAVSNDATGSSYGSFTTSTIAPNATIQISMPTIEAGVPIASPSGQYMLNISGSISGYAQHVMLNTANGTFVDLSGFRIGNATTGFP